MHLLRAVPDSRRVRPLHMRSRQERAPVVEVLQRSLEHGAHAFSCPGHKGGGNAPEILRALIGSQAMASDIWRNTGDMADVLQDAEDLAADAWGAKSAHFLVNGSSSGNQALLQAVLNPGDTVIMARDVHRSMVAGMIMCGARPVYVAPRLEPLHDFSTGIHPDDIRAAGAAHPDARAVVITSPTYAGVVSDVASIAGIAHGRGIPLIVDQAWGAHLRFHPRLPQCAIEAGADGVVISLHKTIGALSQGAALLTQGMRIDRSRLRAAVEITQTTSRYVPLLASIDASRRQMATQGWALMERTLSLAERARTGLRRLPGLQVIDAASLGLPPERFDPTRLVIDTTGIGMSGFEVEKALRDTYGIAPEMSDARGIVCIVTLGDDRASVDALVGAMTMIALGKRDVQRNLATVARSTGEAIAPGEQVMTPREAHFAVSRDVPIERATGHIAAGVIVPYPPGIPVLMPGERITADRVRYLLGVVRAGGHCSGLTGREPMMVRVVGTQ